MTFTLAIDPGTTHSGWVSYDSGRVADFGKWENEDMLERVREDTGDYIAIEMIASYGMPVGAEVFETCVWIGRFIQAWSDRRGWADTEPIIVYRKDVKMHLCGTTKAKDGNIRQAIIDIYGGKDKAIGKKASPGPLYGIAGDVWAAVGVALAAEARMSANELGDARV